MVKEPPPTHCYACRSTLRPRDIRKGYRRCKRCLWHLTIEERAAKRRKLTDRFAYSKRAAIKRRLIWNLSKTEYGDLIAHACFYCAYLLGTPVRKGVGLDRLDNSKGYETGNVVSCCYVCNTIRNEHLTPHETKVAVQAIISDRDNRFSNSEE